MTKGRQTLRERLVGAVERVRGRIPPALLPAVVRLRFWLAWARPAVRADARAQMGYVLEHTAPEADLERSARAYLRRQIWRGELRWHPELISSQRVLGIEHLVEARERGRGVLLNFMHHGTYDGAFPSVARCGVTCHMVVHDYMLREDTPSWLRQHVRVASGGGNTPVSAAIGTAGITDLLTGGHVVAIASDVPGRTTLRFLGRDVLGSFGAARLAAGAGSPVVVMTAGVDAHGPYVRLHEPLEPTDFDSPQDLLVQMLARHEQAVLTWPEETDLPLSRWGAVEASDG